MLLTVVIPLGGCLLVPVLGRVNERLMKWYTVAVGFVTAGLTVALVITAGRQGPLTGLWWIPGINARIALQLTGIGVYVAAIAGCIGALALLYSIRYMEPLEEQYEPTRYYFLTLLFVGSMIALALSDNFLVLYVFWEIIGFCSFALIAYEYRRDEARRAGTKAFIVTRFGDIGLLIGVVVLWSAMSRLGSDDPFSITGTITAAAGGQIPLGLLAIAGAGFIAAAVGKSAQFPLHVWLPDAMEAPTTISALIHAATLVNAGVYLTARTMPLFEYVAWWLPALAWIGAISALLTAILALMEKDLKRVLAFSTISQLGYMMAGVGAASVFASQFHLLNHAVFKALLFLCAGSVIHSVHTNNMYHMGGLRRSMPVTHWTFFIGTLALAGVPLFNGFWSKDAVFEALLEQGLLGPLVILIATAFLTAIYSWRMYWLTFQDEPRREAEPHEAPWEMTAPLVALAAGTLLSWLYVGGYSSALALQLPFHSVPHIELGELWHHTFTSPMIVVAATVVAILVWLGMRWARTEPPVPEGPQMWADLLTDTKGLFDWFWGFWAVMMRAVASLVSLCQTGDLNYNSLWLAIGFVAVLMLLGWG
ncbi:MAG: NADH-quinone oxidoreductase subunit L [Armatimonadota bacterium]